MKKVTEFSGYLALAANIFLFLIKSVAAFFSGSIALISDAMNSLTDVIASISLMFCIKISHKRADHTHPFGHRRAEPIGGMIVAIIAALLGFEVAKEAVLSFFSPSQITLNIWIYGAVAFSIIAKLGLYLFFNHYSKKHGRVSIKALAYDSINDVAASSLVLFTFILYSYGVRYVDSIMGIIIGIWIIRNGIHIGMENIDYLMGKTPNEKVIKKIKKAALSVKNVKSLNDVFAHYVGPYAHAEVHIEIDKKINLKKAHSISKKVQKKIEDMVDVDRAFIHIDPI